MSSAGDRNFWVQSEVPDDLAKHGFRVWAVYKIVDASDLFDGVPTAFLGLPADQNSREALDVALRAYGSDV